ncbi:DUF736 family protein [Hellea balneolensis]|uniref:DUF736 family protein n=1 Tax=Hellea balneolensis TaxID=287478 RepID=UPI000416A551|nr:DUF736 family protein [Hellea balneolensis]
MIKTCWKRKALEGDYSEGVHRYGFECAYLAWLLIESRKAKTQELDGNLFGDAMGEVGAAWNMTGGRSGKKYTSAMFDISIFRRVKSIRLWANLGQCKDVKDKTHALIWSPRS